MNEDRYLLHLSRYIHLNPVKAGLVTCPEDWEFSSYREYVELRLGDLPRVAAVRKQVGTAVDYRAFMGMEGDLVGLQHLLFDE